MCVTTSRYEISGKNSHLFSQKVFLRSIIHPAEKTIHWNKQHFGMRYPPPLFLHYVSTIKHYWSIEHCLLLLLFLTLFLHYFCFCSFLIIKKTIHGPGPWEWSMDPVQSGGPWTPGPCFILTQNQVFACTHRPGMFKRISLTVTLKFTPWTRSTHI